MSNPSMRELTLEELLAEFADRTPAPGGGAAAGIGCALAAALAEMGARFAGLEDVAERAAAVRADALRMAEADAAGYAPVLEAVRLPKDTPDREVRLHAALAAAADVPLAIAEAAAEAAALARRVAAEGRPALTGDALTGADLAAAAARAAARLVAIDLEHAPDDPRLGRARAAAERAAG
jgi:methenyltetrahydrofolate cyclohydrolase